MLVAARAAGYARRVAPAPRDPIDGMEGSQAAPVGDSSGSGNQAPGFADSAREAFALFGDCFRICKVALV